ncbi:MAG: hypothetical protein WCF94_02400 [bacterium]
MIATSTIFTNDFPKWVVTGFFQAFENGNKLACEWLWIILITFLKQNWLIITIIVSIVVIISTLKALSGYWGTLGSVLYNIFYFGILFVLALIFGPEIFISNWYEPLCAIILYPLCYYIVGKILNSFGIVR